MSRSPQFESIRASVVRWLLAFDQRFGLPRVAAPEQFVAFLGVVQVVTLDAVFLFVVQIVAVDPCSCSIGQRE